MENRGTQQLSSLAKVLQLVSGRDRIYTQAVWLQS